jgi:hypothetical protein
MHPDAAIVARITDAEQTPLLVAHSFGEGRAAFLLSPPGSEFQPDRWNRLDDPMVAFPLLHGLAKWLALPAVDPFLVRVGNELTCSVPVRPDDVQVQRPERDGRKKTPVGEDARPLPGGRFQVPPVTDTVYAGFYLVDMELDHEAGKETVTLPFAVNVDPDEGELRYAAHEEVKQALGVERVLDSLPAVADAATDEDRGDLGPTFLLLLMLAICGEAALARFVSMRRS